MNEQQMLETMFTALNDHAKAMMAAGNPAHTGTQLANSYINAFASEAPEQVKTIISILAARVVDRDEYTLWLHYNGNAKARSVVNAMIADGCRRRGMSV